MTGRELHTSIDLVTRNAASVMTSVPTRTWPCSIMVTAAFRCSAILRRVMTTGSRLLANAETVTLFSTELSFEADDRMPMSCSLSSRSFSVFRRTALSGGSRLRRCASWRRDYIYYR